KFDIILADNNLPTYDGISALKSCNEKYSDYPFIFVSGTLGEEIAIDMLKKGASDYVLKNNLKRLVPSIEHSIYEGELKRQKRLSEKKYENLVNTAADIIFTLDEKNCIITSLNPAFEKQTGYSSGDYTGKPFTELLNPADVNKFILTYDDVIKNKANKSITIRAKTVKREFKHLEINVQPLFEHDILTGLLCIARDVTEALKAEEEIKKLSTAIKQSSASVVITDFKGNIEYVNRKFTEITGYLPEEVIGKNPRLLKSGETDPDKYKELWDTITEGKEWKGEFINKKKNGELYWESESISPIYNNGGSITNFLAVKEDITEKKTKETELIKAKEKAEESSRLKSCFLANMSHELRTPMMAILGFSEILTDVIMDEQTREYAQMIHQGGERLMETLNLILNLSIIEAEKLKIQLSRLDIIKEVKETINFYKNTAEKKKLYLKMETQQDSVFVDLDSNILRQVISNVLNNAIKFTDTGGITVRINRETKGDTTFAVIRITDTGLGIHKEMHNVIWEEYRQVSEGLNRSFEGTGLGLSITKKFVSKLGGEIFLEKSEIGKGSTFAIYFPLAKESIMKPEIKNTGNGNGNHSFKAESENSKNDLPKILYVEDDPRTVYVVNLFLRDICHLDSAIDSNECIKKVRENKYKAILMDINLSKGLDGIQTTEIVRTIPGYEDIPIIAVTAYAMKGDKEEFLQKGCTHYISKPFNSKKLKEILIPMLTLSKTTV
ncbi:MAG: PAS domain S-box protein, partial [Ignavibacteria bacterium]|nr:PAS domain S-box protein [Ignavibacteria bacterium]